MRLTVFGASGGAGREVVRLACAAGHDVTAVVRTTTGRATTGGATTGGATTGGATTGGATSGWGDTRDPHLEVVHADVMASSGLDEAISGRDAVISALGSRQGRAPTTVCRTGTANIIEAMGRVDVRRLVVVSAGGFDAEGDGVVTRRLLKPLLQRALAGPYADMQAMEDLVRTTELDWTIVRPPRLTDGRRTGAYRTAVGRSVRGGHLLSRADLADHLLAVAASPGTAQQMITVAR